MKKLTLWMMALAALQGSEIEAQNISGNWQGTLQAGPQKVRIVFKIAPDTGAATPWRIGSFLTGAGLFRSLMDDVRIYDRR